MGRAGGPRRPIQHRVAVATFKSQPLKRGSIKTLGALMPPCTPLIKGSRGGAGDAGRPANRASGRLPPSRSGTQRASFPRTKVRRRPPVVRSRSPTQARVCKAGTAEKPSAPEEKGNREKGRIPAPSSCCLLCFLGATPHDAQGLLGTALGDPSWRGWAWGALMGGRGLNSSGLHATPNTLSSF